MKSIFIIFALAYIPFINYGQALSFSLSPTLNSVSYYRFVAGGVSYRPKFGINTSFEYDFINDKKVSFGFGIAYQFTQVKIIFPITDPYEVRLSHIETVNLISASIKTIFKFKNERYLSIDPFFDLQLKSESQEAIDNQTGLGLSIAYGKRIFIKENIFIGIEPRIWLHSIIPFYDENIPLRLTAAGIKIRIGIRE